MDPIKATRKLPKTPRAVTRTAPAPGGFLVHIYPSGPYLGSRYALHTVPVVLGRDPDCDIAVPDSAASRRHARVEPRAGGYYVVDLGSTNGTFVNGEAAGPDPLQDGDYLQVGCCIYRFLAGGNVEAGFYEEIYRLTIIDGLTGVHNKRYLLECLDLELARSRRYKRPLALVLFDIDHFKAVNDRLGHLAGDEALRQVAACVRGTVRREEVFARYGGEEFVLVLPETDLTSALQAADRLRRKVEDQQLEHQGKTFQVTVSAGVTVWDGVGRVTATELLQRADEKLYEAKRAGRNRVRG
jgi:diguanylate cyclase (GGDEF)-like protein